MPADDGQGLAAAKRVIVIALLSGCAVAPQISPAPQESAAPPPVVAATPAPEACRCKDQPPAPEPAQPVVATSPTDAQQAVTVAANVVGIFTGNPIAWNLIGVLTSHLIGAVGASLRRKSTP